MALGVSFGTQVLYQPGAYTRVDGSALQQTGGLAFGRVCCIGPALGGEPFAALAFQDPAEALKVYGSSSPLGQAIALAFQGGVNGGATEVVGVRCDNSTKASGVSTSNNGVALAATHKDFGAYGNTFSVSFEPGSNLGARVSVEGVGLDGRPYRRRFDNRTSLSGIVSEVNRLTPVNLAITAGGTAASQTMTLATNQVDGRATVTHVAAIDNETYLYQYPSNLINNPAGSLIASFDATIQYAVASVAANTLTVTGHDFVDDQRVKFSGTTLPTGLNAATTYFVVNSDTNEFQVSLTEGGAPVSISGSPSACVVTLAPTEVTLSAGLPASLNATFPVSSVVLASVVGVVGAAFTLTAYGSASYRLTLPTAANWGSQAVPGRIFEIASGPYAGLYQILGYEYDPSGNSSIRIIRKLDSGSINPGSFTGNLEFWSAFRLTRTQPTTSPIQTALPGNGVLESGGQYLTVTVGDTSVYYSTQPGDTIQDVAQNLANQLNDSEELDGLVSVVPTYDGGTYTATLTVTAIQSGIAANSLPVNIVVNTQSNLLVARNGSTLSGGIDPPLPLNSLNAVALVISLSGGYDSAPLYQDWLQAFDVIKTINAYWIVPTTDDLGVQTALQDHCETSALKRRERRMVTGHGLGWTPEQIRDRAEVFNNGRTIFVSPGFRAPDFVTGKQKWYPAYLNAAKIAGMCVAEGIADPITHSYLTNVSQLEIVYQSGSEELDLMIQSGVCCIEPDPAIGRPSRGFRVVRGISTLRTGSGFEGITIWTQSDYVAARIRDRQETLFVGRGITPGIFNQIVYETNKELLLIRNSGGIFGFEPTRTVAKINPELQTAIDVSYVVYPAPGLEFILNNQILSPIPPSQSSSTISTVNAVS